MAIINKGESAGVVRAQAVNLFDSGEQVAAMILYGYHWQDGRLIQNSGGNGGNQVSVGGGSGGKEDE